MARTSSAPGSTRRFLGEFGEMVMFAGRALRALPGTPRFTAEVFRQTGILVRGSTLPIAVMAALIGFSGTTFAYFFLRAAGAADFLGLFTGLTVPRAAAPIIFGYIFAAKVGCGIVAEIGALRVNEEIDAYEAEAIDPLRFVVGTRILSAVLFTPIAALVTLIADTAGSYLDGVVVLSGLSSAGFLRYHWGVQTIQDQLFAIVNLGTIAVLIVVVSCFYGFRTRGGPEAVGASVARSLLVNLVMVHVLSAFFVAVFYGTDPRLPIGG